MQVQRSQVSPSPVRTDKRMELTQPQPCMHGEVRGQWNPKHSVPRCRQASAAERIGIEQGVCLKMKVPSVSYASWTGGADRSEGNGGCEVELRRKGMWSPTGRERVCLRSPVQLSHTVNEKHSGREGEKRAKRTPHHHHHLPCPIRHTGLRGWMERRALIGRMATRGGVRVTATQHWGQETGMHEKSCLTLSVE